MSVSRVGRLQTLSTLHRQQVEQQLSGPYNGPAPPTGAAPAVSAAGPSRRATIHRRGPPVRAALAATKRHGRTAAANAAEGEAAGESSAAGPSPSETGGSERAGGSGLSPPPSARDGKYSSQHVMQSDTLLGTGAFGAVYLGVHDSTGEMVAIKKVRLGADSDDARKQVELLVCEIKLMKQLEHPNVVRYLHAERQGDCLCIFMEYMAGGSLNGLLKKFGKLSPNVVKVYMRHSLEGIAYLHRRNIVHRDIKPDNILLASSGDAKLSDFGTSREFNDSANLLTVTGTPWFMAPEVVKGSGHGAAADMWSVGCTMLQLVTGKAPMEEFPNPVTAMYQIATHPEKVMQLIPASLSSECADVIRACLHEDPMQRATAPQLLSFPYFLEEAPTGPLRPATAPASRQQPLRAPEVPATSTIVRRPSGGGAVPAVPQLPLNAPVDGLDGHNEAGSRPGTPTIGTPRSFATRLREQTQHEQ